MDKITTAQMRIINQKKIFELIYAEKRISKQDIAEKLQISLPTITQNLKELAAMHIIEKNGFFESTGGRKAQTIACVAAAKVAIGVEVAKDSFSLAAIDLYGETIRQARLEIPYVNDSDYYEAFGAAAGKFIRSLHLPAARILGVGIAIQGLISPDGSMVTYGKILDCTGVTVDKFARFFSCPCCLIHDAEAAAIAELWFAKDTVDAIFVNINLNIGGAVIINGKLHPGQELKSGMLEHMTLKPGGKPCYCGKLGCLEAYCSGGSLLDGRDRTLDEFFAALHADEPAHLERWYAFLQDLALALNNLHMVIDCDVLLGGSLASYLTPEDIGRINRLVGENAAFPLEQPFVKASRCKSDAAAVGAALQYVEAYFKGLFNVSR